MEESVVGIVLLGWMEGYPFGRLGDGCPVSEPHWEHVPLEMDTLLDRSLDSLTLASSIGRKEVNSINKLSDYRVLAIATGRDIEYLDSAISPTPLILDGLKQTPSSQSTFLSNSLPCFPSYRRVTSPICGVAWYQPAPHIYRPPPPTPTPHTKQFLLLPLSFHPPLLLHSGTKLSQKANRGRH